LISRVTLIVCLVQFLAVGCAPDPIYRSPVGNATAPAPPVRKAAPAPPVKPKKHPMVPTGVYQEGVASYYAHEFNGRLTASGEVYDMNKLTAAHKELPFGTMVRVTNLDNGKSVVVRINDRGPFVKNRIIDLSLEAAKRIGLVSTGTARVRLEIVP